TTSAREAGVSSSSSARTAALLRRELTTTFNAELAETAETIISALCAYSASIVVLGWANGQSRRRDRRVERSPQIRQPRRSRVSSARIFGGANQPARARGRGFDDVCLGARRARN